jgi:hypothetical protein
MFSICFLTFRHPELTRHTKDIAASDSRCLKWYIAKVIVRNTIIFFGENQNADIIIYPSSDHPGASFHLLHVGQIRRLDSMNEWSSDWREFEYFLNQDLDMQKLLEILS